MRYIAFDFETHLIRQGAQAPQPICMAYTEDGETAHLVKAKSGLLLLREWLSDPEVVLLGYNVAFDLMVAGVTSPAAMLPLIFEAYAQDRVECARVQQILLQIAAGQLDASHKFDMASVAARMLDVKAEGKTGEDAWRLRYAELEHVPLGEWPEAAVRYVKQDALLTWQLWSRQRWWTPQICPSEQLHDLHHQCRADFALKLAGAWGVHTDINAIRDLEKMLHENIDTKFAHLTQTGLYRAGGTRKDPKWVKNTEEVKRRVIASVEHPEYTDKGNLKIDDDALSRSSDPDLRMLQEIGVYQKLLTTYLPALYEGSGGLPIHPFWNVLVRSGRTSCSRPNLQNQPRMPGVREAFVPRPGNVFISCDYNAAELRSLAQVLVDWFGHSRLAEVLNSGTDPHKVTGANILGIDFETYSAWYDGPHEPACEPKKCVPECKKHRAKEARQAAKAANFGYPGGLSAKSFVSFAWATYGVAIDEQSAEAMKQAWFDAYPEMRSYFQQIKSMVGGFGMRVQLQQARSGRYRGDCGFTDGSNTFFQGLTADGKKDAMWHAVREMYDPTFSQSPLYGCRLIADIHDELFVEAPEATAPEAAKRLAEVMIERMSVWLPDVAVTAEPSLMRRWSKAASDPVYDKNGRLIPYEDSLTKK